MLPTLLDAGSNYPPRTSFRLDLCLKKVGHEVTKIVLTRAHFEVDVDSGPFLMLVSCHEDKIQRTKIFNDQSHKRVEEDS